MSSRSSGTSPRTQARMAGILYVLEGIASLFGQVLIPRMLVVPGNPAQTASSIAGNGSLFRLSLALGLLAAIFHTAQTALLYCLLRPAGRSAARHFAFFSLVMISLQAGTTFLQLPAMVAHEHALALGGGSAASLQSLAPVFMSARARAFNIYLAFFGIRCGLIGHLILRSGFIPPTIGVLMGFAGLGYLVYLWPPLANLIYPFNLVLAAPGELSLLVWLLVVGVDAERWREQVAVSEAGALVAGGGSESRATRSPQVPT